MIHLLASHKNDISFSQVECLAALVLSLALLVSTAVLSGCGSQDSVPGLTPETEVAGMQLGSVGWDTMLSRIETEDDAFSTFDLTIFDKRVSEVLYPPEEMFAYDQSFRDVFAYGIDGEVYLAYRSLRSPTEENYKALRDSLISRFSEPTTTISPTRATLYRADNPDSERMRRAYGYDPSDPDVRLQQSYDLVAWESDSVRVVLMRVESEFWQAPSGQEKSLMDLDQDEAVVDTLIQGGTLILEENGRGAVERWTERDPLAISNPAEGTATAKLVALRNRLEGRLDRTHPALDTLSFIGQLPLRGEKGDTNYQFERITSSFSGLETDRTMIEVQKVQPFVSDLYEVEVSHISADFAPDDSVSTVTVDLQSEAYGQTASELYRDVLRLFADRFGTPDVEYIDNDSKHKGHVWYTDGRALDLRLGDEEVAFEITLRPGSRFFLHPDRLNR